MHKERISVLGCGWLGLPLAEQLAAEGYMVRGSTTRDDKLEGLREKGIDPFLIRFDPEAEGDGILDFLQSDVLIVNIPPPRRSDVVEYHIAQFSSLIDALGQSPVRFVLMVSSTSVYPAAGGRMREDDAGNPESAAGQALLFVEEMLMAESGFQTTIIRFGGLTGYERAPRYLLAHLSEISDPDKPMNLIHRDDAVAIIGEIIRLGQWGEIFNACAPHHPSRRDYYGQAAERAGIPMPPIPALPSTPSSTKLVDSQKLVAALDYSFRHPDLTALPE